MAPWVCRWELTACWQFADTVPLGSTGENPLATAVDAAKMEAKEIVDRILAQYLVVLMSLWWNLAETSPLYPPSQAYPRIEACGQQLFLEMIGLAWVIRKPFLGSRIREGQSYARFRSTYAGWSTERPHMASCQRMESCNDPEILQGREVPRMFQTFKSWLHAGG
jgi:hypothetical protein